MIDLEVLNFLYDYQSQTPKQQRAQIAQLHQQAEDIVVDLRALQSTTATTPQDFIFKIHQLKSSALVLCSNDLNGLFLTLNQWPLAHWDASVVAQKVEALILTLIRYQQELTFLNSFIRLDN